VCEEARWTVLDRITVKPDKMDGQPCIRGMRFTVAHLLRLVADGWTLEQIQEEYPFIEDEDIRHRPLVHHVCDTRHIRRERTRPAEQSPSVTPAVIPARVRSREANTSSMLWAERLPWPTSTSVPTMFRMLLGVPDLESRFDLSSVRVGLCGGEPMSEATFEEVRRRFGFEILEMIGQTEAHVYAVNRPARPVKVGSLGEPIPGRAVAVLD
jgi:uncharacterized protein (DUF433 family)/acyl-CoA synthetase (AMP-forming)/AMP-acid ligase II